MSRDTNNGALHVRRVMCGRPRATSTSPSPTSTVPLPAVFDNRRSLETSRFLTARICAPYAVRFSIWVASRAFGRDRRRSARRRGGSVGQSASCFARSRLLRTWRRRLSSSPIS
jgi:hypothetical protein